MHSMHHESIKPVSHSFSRPVSSCCKLHFFLARLTKAFVQRWCAIYVNYLVFLLDLEDQVLEYFYLSMPAISFLSNFSTVSTNQLSVTSIGSLEKRNFSSFFNKSLWNLFERTSCQCLKKKEFNKELHWPRRWKCALINLIRRKRILELNAILWAK